MLEYTMPEWARDRLRPSHRLFQRRLSWEANAFFGIAKKDVPLEAPVIETGGIVVNGKVISILADHVKEQGTADKDDATMEEGATVEAIHNLIIDLESRTTRKIRAQLLLHEQPAIGGPGLVGMFHDFRPRPKHRRNFNH